MLRRILFPAPSARKPDDAKTFVHRGVDVSRIECFSDCVFAFALTLLVVSLEVPKTFDDLRATLPGFAGFAGCFGILMTLWYRHSLFFRRYGLGDRTIVVLNSLLLFVLLFYVYPLRFLASVFVAVFTAIAQGTGPLVRTASGAYVKPLNLDQMPQLMTLYLAGWSAIYALFALMHAHAWREREKLELTPHELEVTRAAISIDSAVAGISLVAIGLSWLGPPISNLAPLVLVFIGVLRRRFKQRLKYAH